LRPRPRPKIIMKKVPNNDEVEAKAEAKNNYEKSTK